MNTKNKNNLKSAAIVMAVLLVVGTLLYLQNGSILQGNLRTQPLDNKMLEVVDLDTSGQITEETTGKSIIMNDFREFESGSNNEDSAIAVNTTADESLDSQGLCPWFKDVPPTHPHYDAVEFGVTQGYIERSVDNCTFGVDEAIKRFEMAIRIVDAFQLEMVASTDGVFLDVPQSIWYRNYIITANYHNIMDGFMEEEISFFYPEQDLTRAEMVNALYRGSISTLTAPVSPSLQVAQQVCPDMPEMSVPWADPPAYVGYFQYFKNNNYMEQNELCRGEESATNGEVAELIYQLLK